MHHIATRVKFLDKVIVECCFNDGKIYRYDISNMFEKYPQFIELEKNRRLFESGCLSPGGFGLIWNDELDLDCSSIYEYGTFVGEIEVPLIKKVGVLLSGTREDTRTTQKELAKLSGIHQADISRIEDGKGNPTLKKIEKLFNAMGKSIVIKIK